MAFHSSVTKVLNLKGHAGQRWRVERSSRSILTAYARDVRVVRISERERPHERTGGRVRFTERSRWAAKWPRFSHLVRQACLGSGVSRRRLAGQKNDTTLSTGVPARQGLLPFHLRSGRTDAAFPTPLDP